jgi:hypothetical protein
MFRLQGSHHQAAYIRSIRKLYICCLHIVENGPDLGLTYTSIHDCYTGKYIYSTKVLYKIKQLGYIVLKMTFETSNFSILGWW